MAAGFPGFLGTQLLSEGTPFASLGTFPIPLAECDGRRGRQGLAC